jgi:hypothetical protein
MAQITEGLLIVGSVEVPIHNYFSLNQDYTLIGGAFSRRSLNGTGRKQTHWQKISTAITANGSLPVGLSTMDFSVPYQLHCAAFRSVKSVSNVIQLPGNWRVDQGYTPRGFGLVGSEWKETSYVESPAGTFTLTAVAGASSYELRYWPILTVLSDPPTESNDIHGKVSNWTLSAEEV